MCVRIKLPFVRAQNTLVQKEEELAHVKLLYCAAVKEKQVRIDCSNRLSLNQY